MATDNKVWFAVVDTDYSDWDNGSFDRSEAERIAWGRVDDGHDGVKIAVIENGNFCSDEIEPEDFHAPHMVGSWWNDRDIDIVEIDGGRYALNGWNGEKYTDCFKVIDRFTPDPDDDRVYEIAPVYDWSEYDEDTETFCDPNGNAYNGLMGYEIH